MSNTSHQGVLVFVEQRNGAFQKVSLELVSRGREIADELGCKLKGALLKSKMKDQINLLIQHGCDEVYVVDSPALEPYTTEPYAKALSRVIEITRPEIVLIGATTIGRDLAPRVAARINTGLTADCTKLEIDPDTRGLLMTRPAFGGNIMATIICPDHRPQMSTVRPGVMQLNQPDHQRTGRIIPVEMTFGPEDMNVEVLEVVVESKKKVHIEEADVLFSGGRGVGGPENMGLLYSLADKLGGMVSSSRAVVDAGWIDRNQLVGQTGKTVRPGLYLACGISGAIQHLAGMEESELIIAINKDEAAPIFDVADLSIVGDVKKVIPEIIKLLPERKLASN